MHPGEVLREEYLAPLGITPYALAAALRLSRTHVECLVREEISLMPSTALRLAGYFGTLSEPWVGIQARFDKHAMKLRSERLIANASSRHFRSASRLPAPIMVSSRYRAPRRCNRLARNACAGSNVDVG
jgi:addiction module HigA family antidote